MINVTDLHTISMQQSIDLGGARAAQCFLRYLVHEITDARNLGSNRAYRVECKIRVMVSSDDATVAAQVMTPLPAPPHDPEGRAIHPN